MHVNTTFNSSPEDCGRIIGKKGTMINAIRTVLNSTTFSKKVYLDLVE